MLQSFIIVLRYLNLNMQIPQQEATVVLGHCRSRWSPNCCQCSLQLQRLQWLPHLLSLWMCHSKKTMFPAGLLIISITSMVEMRFIFLLENGQVLLRSFVFYQFTIKSVIIDVAALLDILSMSFSQLTLRSSAFRWRLCIEYEAYLLFHGIVAGTGFQSKGTYLFGHFSMQIKMVPSDSAGIVTAFYVRNMLMFHIFVNFLLSSSVACHPQLLLGCKEIIEALVDLHFPIFLIVVYCACFNNYRPRTLSMMKQTLSSQAIGLGSPTFFKIMFSVEERETENSVYTFGSTPQHIIIPMLCSGICIRLCK